jgi:hypothetical protein
MDSQERDSGTTPKESGKRPKTNDSPSWQEILLAALISTSGLVGPGINVAEDAHAAPNAPAAIEDLFTNPARVAEIAASLANSSAGMALLYATASAEKRRRFNVHLFPDGPSEDTGDPTAIPEIAINQPWPDSPSAIDTAELGDWTHADPAIDTPELYDWTHANPANSNPLLHDMLGIRSEEKAVQAPGSTHSSDDLLRLLRKILQHHKEMGRLLKSALTHHVTLETFLNDAIEQMTSSYWTLDWSSITRRGEEAWSRAWAERQDTKGTQDPSGRAEDPASDNLE